MNQSTSEAYQQAYDELTQRGYIISLDAFFASPTIPYIKSGGKLYVSTNEAEHPEKSFASWTYEYHTQTALPKNSRLKRYNKNTQDYSIENLYLPNQGFTLDEALYTKKLIVELFRYYHLVTDVAVPSQHGHISTKPANIFNFVDLFNELDSGMRFLSNDEQTLLREFYIDDMRVKDIAQTAGTRPQSISIKVTTTLEKLAHIQNAKFQWHLMIADWKRGN